MTRLRDVESVFKRTTTYNFDVGHGIRIRDKYQFVLPAYQRPLVWSDEQKSRFVESLWLHLPVGTYCYHESLDGGVTLTLLDGQQRWSAIYDFVDGKVPAFGAYWHELDRIDHTAFEFIPFSAYVARGFSEKDMIDIYERLAYGGTPNVKGEAVGKVRRLAKGKTDE